MQTTIEQRDVIGRRENSILGALSLIYRGWPAGRIQLPNEGFHTQPGLDKASNSDI